MPSAKRTTPKRAPSKRTAKQTKSDPNEINLSIKPGTKTVLTIETGKEHAGEIPVRIRLEQSQGGGKIVSTSEQVGAAKEANKVGRWLLELGRKIRSAAPFVKKYDLATWMFWSALGVYLLTRLIGLTKFPIYFFVDEALQTQFAADLVNNGYRGFNDTLLPPAFQNGTYFTLGMAVYMQLLPYLIFGKSALVTRITSVLVTLIAASSVGLILRDGLKVKHWWAGVLFLSITPTWFLHSRTAWEMGEFVGFYSGALCAYMYYRIKSPKYLFLAIFLGALAFYTYSPGQVLVPFTALALAVFDLRHHWENRRTILFGLVLLAIMVIPYLRFRAMDPDNALAHLHNLGSYLFSDMPLLEKLQKYFTQYFLGLGAWYWYIPTENTLQRHIMKGYGHIMIVTLPFALFGLAETIRRVREPSYRILLTAWLASPVASAFVEIGITRVLIYVVSTAILAAIGLERMLEWIEDPAQRVKNLMSEPAPSRGKILTAVGILALGGLAAFFAEHTADKVAASVLAVILALQVSGVFGSIARRIKKSNFVAGLKRWKISQVTAAVTVFLVMAGMNVFMLSDALRNGPTWYREYGMGGLQYGAFQVFEPIKQYIKDHPQTRVLFSPNWANGTDVVARFFLGDPLPVQLHSIQGYVENKLPMDDDTLFIMTKEEYEFAITSDKLSDIQVEQTIPYPDGTPGFYFVRLRYSDKAEALFAAEKAVRSVIQESTIKIAGEDVHVRHTYLEANDQSVGIFQIFDGDPYTYAKTYEANPFHIEMTFPSPRELHGFSIIIGSARVSITVTAFSAPGAEPVTYTFEGQGAIETPELRFDFPEPLTVQVLYVDQLDLNAATPAKNHVWELILR